MKYLLVFTFCAVALLFSCKDDNNTDPTNEAVGKYLTRTECKNLILFDDYNTNQECIKYSYKDNVLTIKHINTGMNCCPDPMNATVTVENGIITIDESKAANGCKCMCLFDVDYKIENLQAGTYKIVIKEFLDLTGQEVLESTIELNKTPDGDFCAQRLSYPWDRG
jgi:hypothetical protein